MTAQPERDFVLFSRFIEVVLEKVRQKRSQKVGPPKKTDKGSVPLVLDRTPSHSLGMRAPDRGADGRVARSTQRRPPALIYPNE